MGPLSFKAKEAALAVEATIQTINKGRNKGKNFCISSTRYYPGKVPWYILDYISRELEKY